MKSAYLVAAPSGAILGFLLGMLTRPSVMGIQIPLGVLTSAAEFDQPSRETLATHLSFAVLGGMAFALLAVALGELIDRYSNAGVDRQEAPDSAEPHQPGREPPVSTTIYRIAIAAGAISGFAVSMATRPALLGEPLPLRLLFSEHPQDQMYREALSTHLIWGSLGIMVSVVLLLALAERLVFGASPRLVKASFGQLDRFAASAPPSIKRYLLAALGGSVFGLANGMIIRPTVLGMPIPLETLFSSSPLDEPFRTQFADHLALAAVIGLILSLLLLAAVERLIAEPEAAGQ